jgi:ribonucleoside-diphosphate reductase beta chain
MQDNNATPKEESLMDTRAFATTSFVKETDQTFIPFPKAKLFNPEGNDDVTSRKMIGGNSTNILQLNNVRYKWALQLKKTMYANHWLPEKNSLQSDRFTELTGDQKETFVGILSFLIFLDSIQTANVPNIADYITAPEVKILLAIQAFQEAVHSDSYQYIIESLIPRDMRDGIYDKWRDDPILFERNKFIAQQFQDFLDAPTEMGFKRVIMANYILESIYFYNGFQFFYLLASQGLMTGTSRIIKLINKDELTHVTLFRNIIADIFTEDDHEWARVMMGQAVEQEVKWANHVIGGRILGMSNESHEHYTKHLANRRLVALKMKPLYEGVESNPYKHLEERADMEGGGNAKGGFFTDSASYNQSNAVGGFDRF